ncbi:uncharacterized protein BBOV_I001100 [Babesia bovis T2Bo]|uniref:Membrane protein, putative n=1 Tax=Babesia bovis TaxID=5865 RepID=A7AXD0_BABBO|nr:uncharacterized protein BBOV_I001100 [Babesia bovis T2Bo]EDO05203.1 putative integral membrane protein [Babesia bovis T2Bo]|eukprot:XP_001608771.1 hypothetical protein [Babesia bovis T2Bo]
MVVISRRNSLIWPTIFCFIPPLVRSDITHGGNNEADVDSISKSVDSLFSDTLHDVSGSTITHFREVSLITFFLILVMTLGLGFCVALLISVTISGTTNTIGGDEPWGPSTLTVLIFVFYSLLHILGVRSGYVGKPITWWQIAFVSCGFLAVILTCALTLISFQIEYNTKDNLTARVMEGLDIVYAIFSQLFTGQINYIFAPFETIVDVMKAMAPINYLLLIGFCVTAYNVSICYIPWDTWEGVLILLAASTIGILVVILLVFHRMDKAKQTLTWPLCAMEMLFSMLIPFYIKWKQPFKGYYSFYKLIFSVWDAIYVLYVAIITMIMLTVLIGIYRLRVEVNDHGKYGVLYPLITLQSSLTIVLIAYIKYKPPFGHHFDRDNIACATLMILGPTALLAVLLISCVRPISFTDDKTGYIVVSLLMATYGTVVLLILVYSGYRGAALTHR